MLICFFDQKGIVHKEFVPPGQTVNAAFYVEIFKRLRGMCEGSDLISDGTTHGCSTMTIRQPMLPSWLDGFWPYNNMTVVPHPPYSPDLALSEFFLFPKLKMKLKGRRFQMLEEIQAESQAVLNRLWENDFRECFKNWQRRWDLCQASEGDYFEGDAAP